MMIFLIIANTFLKAFVFLSVPLHRLFHLSPLRFCLYLFAVGCLLSKCLAQANFFGFNLWGNCFGKRGSKGSVKEAWKGFPKRGFWSAEGGLRNEVHLQLLQLHLTRANDKRQETMAASLPCFCGPTAVFRFSPTRIFPLLACHLQFFVVCACKCFIWVLLLLLFNPAQCWKIAQKAPQRRVELYFFYQVFLSFGELM